MALRMLSSLYLMRLSNLSELCEPKSRYRKVIHFRIIARKFLIKMMSLLSIRRNRNRWSGQEFCWTSFVWPSWIIARYMLEFATVVGRGLRNTRSFSQSPKELAHWDGPQKK